MTPTTETLDPVRAALRAIEAGDEHIRAFVEVYTDTVSAQVERQPATDWAPPLSGVPIVVKDLYDIGGRVTGNGSPASPPIPARRDAQAVARARAAGAVVVGKTATHEYAYGVNTPPTRNPHDRSRIPGGSSGGTAAAIAAGMATSGLGTDTGGSIRIPAALCGVAGIKPTYGLVGRSGISAISFTLDHAGPLGRSVSDTAALLQAIIGPDPADPFSIDGGTLDVLAELHRGADGLRIGLCENYFCDRLDADVADAFAATVAGLTAAGARIVPIEVPGLHDCPELLTTIASVEALDWHTAQPGIDGAQYGPDVRAALAIGASRSAVDYARAQRGRSALTQRINAIFDDIDLLVSPTVAMTAPEFGSDHVELGGIRTPILDGLNALTIPANLAGIPAMSVPCGRGTDGLPIGFQIMGPPLSDPLVIGLAAAIESRQPPTPEGHHDGYPDHDPHSSPAHQRADR